MKGLAIFIFEIKHFWRHPFKVIALLLFIIAAVYGLHNGASLYNKQLTEIRTIEQVSDKKKQEIINYYDKGETGPSTHPWINVTTPFWAIWNTSIYDFKKPSPTMVYSVGQAEQYGFYKRISVWSSPYDADMAQEIANPERLQSGTLDFAFVLLFLLPLLLLILVYNIKASETEQGFIKLIEVQTASKNTWLLSRLLLYLVLLLVVITALLIYGAIITDVFSTHMQSFWNMLLYSFLYLILWTAIYFFILKKGQTIVANTLKMVGVWLLLAFIIPASVQQYISIKKPTNLMIDFIDAQRDEQQELFEQTDEDIQSQLLALFPEIKNSVAVNDSIKSKAAINQSGAALANELVKESIVIIETDNQEKNALIKSTFWFNPVVFFQNKINAITETHYADYQHHRNTIQSSIDAQIETMIMDLWNDVKVDKKRYLEYHKILTK